MNLTWTVERAGGVSLVQCRVHNDSAVPHRVRVESQLDGPVLPPRRCGVPEAGWDERGVTLRLESDERRAIGFAAPAPPADPPVSIDRSSTVDANETQSGTDWEGSGSVPGARGRGSKAVSDALRGLAEHRPPRAAVAGSGETDDARDDESARRDDVREIDRRAAKSTTDDPESTGTDRGSPSKDPIDDWFEAVERRIERAERVTGADLSTATDVVEAAGGIDELRALDERVESDAERLRELSERAASLAGRAEATDTPVAALERLA